MRARVRLEFEKYRSVKHLPIIDGLIFKGTQNLIEAVSMFQQDNHLMDAFDKQSREDFKAFQAASLQLVNPLPSIDDFKSSSKDKEIADKSVETFETRPASHFLFNFLRKNVAQ